MTSEENKLEILRKVEDGTLSVEEGSDLLGILEQSEKDQRSSESVDPSVVPPTQPEPKHEVSGCWKAFWSMFLVVGAILTGFSAYWITLGYERHGFGWGFWLSWIPLLIGVGLSIFGWALMISPWMHVRVKSKESGRNQVFIFSMPVPFNIAHWVVDHFGRYFPENVNPAEILNILNQAELSIQKGEPFQVQVEDDHENSQVDISIN